MLQLNTKLVGASLCALAVLLACSKSRASTHAAAVTGNAVAGDDAGGPVDTTLDCARVFSPGDVAGILTEPATISTYTLRSGSCSFEAAKDAGTVRIYSGTDFTNELTWNDVTKSVHRTKYAALPGVGDEAYRNIVDGTELFARKGKFYCTVLLIGVKTPASARGEPLSRKMGALCSKVFASR